MHPHPEALRSEEQRRAAQHPATPLVIVAGPGSGKTCVIADRIVQHLTVHGVSPENVLALTFSNKAARNLRDRVIDAVGPGNDVDVRTYHGFSASLVAQHHARLGFDTAPRLLDRAQAWQLCFDAFDDFAFERRATGRPSSIVSDALTLADRCTDHLVDIAVVRADCERIMAGPRYTATAQRAAQGRFELCQVIDAYRAAKRRHNLIDYGDQIALAVELLATHPPIVTDLREQHCVVLLDEFQDTNVAQRRLLQLFVPAGAPVTAVGDDMQSIYGFRGANVGNILEFEQHFGGTSTTLATCYRSGAGLVELAGRVQHNVPRTRPRVLQSAPNAPESIIECFLASDETAEAVTIAIDAQQELARGADVAILCRKRKQMAAIAEALTERDVPVEVFGIGGLLTRPEVVDLVAWLEVLGGAEPGADATIAALRLLRGPRYRLGLGDLAALARHARTRATALEDDPDGADLLDSLDDLDAVDGLSSQGWQRAKQFAAERDGFARLTRRRALPDVLDQIASSTGIWAAVDLQGRENVLRLIELAAEFEPIERPIGVGAFCEYLQLRLDAEDEPAEALAGELGDGPRVRLLTVHQAKGLEFDVVYLPGLAGRGSSTYFPDARLPENPASQTAVLPWWLREDHFGVHDAPRDRFEEQRTREVGRALRMEEEWRLFYVAISRARNKLVCSAAHWYADTQKPQGPSAFFEFIRAQQDLVSVRFQHDPATQGPAAAAMALRAERYRAAVLPPEEPEDRAPAAMLASDAGRLVSLPERLPPLPGAVPVTGLVSFARCPRQFQWSVVTPLPRRPSPAAQFGTLVHSWIAERASGQMALFDAPPTGADARATSMRDAFVASVYGELVPRRVEAPFTLLLDGLLIRGRVDAVYERDGRTELVDLKTGREPVEGDPGASVQLELYALAAVRAWGVPPEQVRTTYCYLREDGVVLHSRDWGAATYEEVSTRIDTLRARLAQTRYETQPGPWCGRCEFANVCPSALKVRR